ncbi:MAG: DNA recombination protein RmuC [Robiginitomaculum sp.]|nr:DNA recombination protein RmuC [Robiginitomaculum sp.]
MLEQLTNIELLIIILVIGFVALFLIVVLLRRKPEQDNHLTEQLSQLHDNQIRMQGAFSAIQETSQNNQSDLKRTLNERLDGMSKKLGDSLGETREKTHESLKSLGERLAIIDRAQKNIEELGQEVNSLQSILANKQSRGQFGEMRMQDMVEDSLPPNAYAFQETLSNGKRVDCLIHLPNGAESIAVDAKFPLESWRALQAASDDAMAKPAAKSLQVDVKKHIDDIAAKYLLPGETTDTALLFLPSEAIYADLHAHFPKLIDHAFKSKVMIVSPTTFMATLLTISSLLKDARMREQAHLIQLEVQKMAQDVRRLDERTQKLDRNFKIAGKAIDEILTSTSRITKRAEKISDVDVAPNEIDANTQTDIKLITRKQGDG